MLERLRIYALVLLIGILVCTSGCGGGGGSSPPPTNNNPVRTVSSISPSNVMAGNAAITVDVTGSNFISSSVCKWSGYNRTTTFVSSTKLQVALPETDFATAGTWQMTVVNPAPGGGTSNAVTFAVNNPTPVLSSLSSTSTLVGSSAFSLTVAGSSFVSGSVVQWNGSSRTTTFVSATQLTAAITANDLATAGTAQVQVMNPAPGGGTSNALTFSINNPVPQLATLLPANVTAGSAAFTLTVNGTLFAVGAVVQWNGTDLTTTAVSATQLQATISTAAITAAGTASVTVFNPGPGGGTSNALTFTINPPTIVGFAYVAGAAGSNRIYSFTMDQSGHLRNTGYRMASYGTPYGLVMAPSKKYLYVITIAGYSLGAVAAYSSDPTTGTLTPLAGPDVFTDVDPRYPAIDPAGKFLFVPNYGSHTISVYSIDSSTGALTQVSGSPFAAGAGPVQAIVDPSGKYLYVTNEYTDDVGAYSINSTTGALTAIAGSPFPAGNEPQRASLDISGKFLYVVNHQSNNLSAFAINPANGVLTAIPGSPFATGWYPDDVTPHPSGKFLYVADMGYNNATGGDIVTYNINGTTGVLTAVGPAVPADVAMWFIRVDSSGKHLYGVSLGTNEMSTFDLNATTGVPTLAEKPFRTESGVAIALLPATKPATYTPKFAYTANAVSNNASAFAIDSAVGSLSPIAGSPFAAGTGPSMLAADSAARFLYVTNPTVNRLLGFRADPTTGALTAVPGSPFSTGTYPAAVGVEPAGRYAYVANKNDNTISAYTIDSSTGTLTPIPLSIVSGLGQGPTSVVMDPAGMFFYVVNSASDNISGFSIDPSSGYPVYTNLSPYASPAAPGAGLIVPSARFLYVLHPNSNTISGYSILGFSGELTAIASSPFTTGLKPVALATDPFGKYLYVAHGQSGEIWGYSIDNLSGELTPVSGSPFTTGATANAALAVDTSGKFLYVQGTSSPNLDAFLAVSSIDPATGNLTAATGTSPATGRGASSVLTTGKIQ